MKSQAKQLFQHLNMLSEGAGLFCVDEKKRSKNEQKTIEKHPWSPRLKRYLHEAGEYGASWVYFRLQSQSGAPRPEIFIFDRTENLSANSTTIELAQLHKKLWNYGSVPLIFVLENTKVDIFNMLSKPSIDNNGNLLEPETLDSLDLCVGEKMAIAAATIKGAKEKEFKKRYDSTNIDNGYFWEMPENKLLGSTNESALSTLVHEMKEARESFEQNFSAEIQDLERSNLVRRLLIIILMIRFLEDRNILPKKYFSDITDEGFLGVLNSPQTLLTALDKLTKDFNGDVFYIEDSIRESIKKLSSDDLVSLANFADNKSTGNQRCFWQFYSFKDLPVEVISYVYEDFLDGKSQSYYTPHHLVELMLDEAMPPSKTIEKFKSTSSKKHFRVLDPSCGSGVFLVGAWERLLEAYNSYSKDPSPKELKDLMAENIYGVDIEENSVELSIFSLSIALCSSFTVKEGEDYLFSQLKQLKFPNLKGKNIQKEDFFMAREKLLEFDFKFDLVIGNPPFEGGGLSEDHKQLAKKITDEDGKSWPAIPDGNIAYLFFRSVLPLLREGGVSCIVQPHGILYNNSKKPALEFQKSLFNNWTVPQVLDFTSIPKLFRSRNTSAAPNAKPVVLFVIKSKPEYKKPLLHATFRRVDLLKQRRFFEIDHQDIHWISWDKVFNEPKVWISNLLGGGRTLETYKFLTSIQSFGDKLKEYQKDRGWISMGGFESESSNPIHKPVEKIEYSKWNYLNTTDFNSDKIDEDKLYPSQISLFHRAKNENIYKPPHLIFRIVEHLPVVTRLTGDPILFRKRIVGISVPNNDIGMLEDVSKYLKTIRNYLPFFASFGSEFLMGRKKAIQKQDIDKLPYIEDVESMITGTYKYIFDDVVNVMIPSINMANIDQKNSNHKAIEEYCVVFSKLMNSVYKGFSHHETIDLGSAWAVSFAVGDYPKKFGNADSIKQHLDELLTQSKGKSLRSQRIIRYFDDKTIYIIKPKAERYWIKSVAVRDADEMFHSAMKSAHKLNLSKK